MNAFVFFLDFKILNNTHTARSCQPADHSTNPCNTWTLKAKTVIHCALTTKCPKVHQVAPPTIHSATSSSTCNHRQQTRCNMLIYLVKRRAVDLRCRRRLDETKKLFFEKNQFKQSLFIQCLSRGVLFCSSMVRNSFHMPVLRCFASSVSILGSSAIDFSTKRKIYINFKQTNKQCETNLYQDFFPIVRQSTRNIIFDLLH